MQPSGAELTRNQERAVLALLAEPTITAAAKATGVNDVTIWRWLQNPVFQSRYRAARRQVVEASIANLQQATGEAVQALRDVMNDPGAPAGSRVSAAKTVLDTALQAVELLDLSERVDALEAVATPGNGEGQRRWRT